jgi:hypothetical protein
MVFFSVFAKAGKSGALGFGLDRWVGGSAGSWIFPLSVIVRVIAKGSGCR